MKAFNLSRWALEHKSFAIYLMLVIALAGAFECLASAPVRRI